MTLWFEMQRRSAAAGIPLFRKAAIPLRHRNQQGATDAGMHRAGRNEDGCPLGWPAREKHFVLAQRSRFACKGLPRHALAIAGKCLIA
jgi:hypothetical protein